MTSEREAANLPETARGEAPILQMRDIRYSYSSGPALKGVDFNLYRGEIHALAGDHRSGKSTLAGIMSGALRKQEGSILLAGRELSYLTPESAAQARIGMVYQTPQILKRLSVLENVHAGRMPHFVIRPRDLRRLEEECAALFRAFDLDIDPHETVGNLSEGRQQIVEIARAMARGAEILILDEVSGRLTPAELERVYAVLRTLKDEGKAVVYITSAIDEIFKIADRVTVLKDGNRRGTEYVTSVDRSRLINLAYSFALNPDEKAGDRGKLLLLSRYDESIIRDMPVGLVLLDGSGGVILVNPAAEKIFGRAGPAGTAGAAGDDLGALLAGPGVERAPEILAAVAARKRRSWPKLVLDGGTIIKLKTFPLEDEEGTFAGTAMLVEDVSFDFVTKEYLSRAEKVASTAELAAGVAHEINNPLGIIQNYVEVLKLSPRNEDDGAVLGKIERELGRIVEIVGSLLSFSRVRRESKAVLCLSVLLDEITLLLGHKLNEKRIELVRSYRRPDAYVEGTENKLKQLFINLLTNAIEAVLDHGRIEIVVDRNDSGSYSEVSIIDDGCGIPPEVREDIFTPFYTTKMTRTNTGLGLSICQHIAELHNGVITFSSIPGRETIFSVRFPF